MEVRSYKLHPAIEYAFDYGSEPINLIYMKNLDNIILHPNLDARHNSKFKCFDKYFKNFPV